MRIFTDKDTGKKLYPVASWQNCQHIFYNYNDRMYNAFMDDPSDENEQKLNLSHDLLDKFDNNPQYNGIVYALYEDYKIMKDIIDAYNARH